MRGLLQNVDKFIIDFLMFSFGLILHSVPIPKLLFFGYVVAKIMIHISTKFYEGRPLGKSMVAI